MDIFKKTEEFFKPFFGYTLVAIAGVLAGLFIGLNSTGKACYLEFAFGGNKISILKPDIVDYDFRKIPEHEASALCTKLKDLKWDDSLSLHLRNLRDSFSGPFQKKVVNVYVKFAEDSGIKYPNAGGYRGKLMNQELSIFYLVEPENLRENFSHKSFQVLVESPKPDSLDEDIAQETIWIDKQYACEWLNIQDKEHLPDRLTVQASIIRKVATLPSEKTLASLFSEGKFN